MTIRIGIGNDITMSEEDKIIATLEEENALLKAEISELLDFTIEAVLEKYMKVYYRKAKIFLDTEKAVIREFLRHVFNKEYV